VIAGTELGVDESMGAFITKFEKMFGELPHCSKIIRKPKGVGVEYSLVGLGSKRSFSFSRLDILGKLKVIGRGAQKSTRIQKSLMS
jgi:hypothetical protein